jgi:hypothetical protein
VLPPTSLVDPAEALAEARRESQAATADATSAGTFSGRPFDPTAEVGQRPEQGGPRHTGEQAPAPAYPPVPPVPPVPPTPEQGTPPAP